MKRQPRRKRAKSDDRQGWRDRAETANSDEPVKTDEAKPEVAKADETSSETTESTPAANSEDVVAKTEETPESEETPKTEEPSIEVRFTNSDSTDSKVESSPNPATDLSQTVQDYYRYRSEPIEGQYGDDQNASSGDGATPSNQEPAAETNNANQPATGSGVRATSLPREPTRGRLADGRRAAGCRLAVDR